MTSEPSRAESTSAVKKTRWRVHAAWAVALTAAVALAVLGTTLVVRPYTKTIPIKPAVSTYVAKDGVLDGSASTTATVAFLKGPPAVAPVGGTITSEGIGDDGVVSAGQQIFTVDLRPVFAATGSVPAFRTMMLGDTGPDISQLRTLLGLPAGQKFDRSVAAGVRGWQIKNNMQATGVVNFGDVIFLPELPTRAYFAEGVVVGSQVNPGQVIVQTVQASPQISVPDSGGALGLKSGMTAAFGSGKSAVVGVLGAPQANGSSGLAYPVTTSEGKSPCDATCGAAFSITAPSQAPISVQTVPRTLGVLVPASAIAVRPDGSNALVGKNGVTLPVTVVLLANGLAIVKGIASGTTIQLFAKDASG